MKQMLEFSVFLVGAAALHLSVLQVAPLGSRDAAGEGGAAALSLAAASSTLQSEVAVWERPPGIAQHVAQPDIPVTSDTLPRPAREASVQPVALPPPAAPAATTAAPALPTVDTAPAARPVMPQTVAPAQAVRPKAKPARPPVVAGPARNPARRAVQPAAKAPEPVSRPAQKAAGTGQKKVSGSAQTGQAPRASAGNPATLVAEWGGSIRNSIERRKRYPAGTRARAAVTLAITVHTSGAVTSLSLRRSSGVALIDRAAIAAVKAAQIGAAPHGLAQGVYTFTLPMKFAP